MRQYVLSNQTRNSERYSPTCPSETTFQNILVGDVAGWMRSPACSPARETRPTGIFVEIDETSTMTSHYSPSEPEKGDGHHCKLPG